MTAQKTMKTTEASQKNSLGAHPTPAFPISIPTFHLTAENTPPHE
jgi:hypothetical protein